MEEMFDRVAPAPPSAPTRPKKVKLGKRNSVPPPSPGPGPSPRHPAPITHYDILQVSPTAEPEAIIGAYKALAKKYHPDRNPGDKKAEFRMKLINQAFGVLGDGKRRAEYDKAIKP
jgi:DnaJ-class molecular chaperone